MTDSAEHVEWWLAEGSRLVDGPHKNREGVEKALYLFRRLGIGRGKNYLCARVELSPVQPVAHDANEDAIQTLNAAGVSYGR